MLGFTQSVTRSKKLEEIKVVFMNNMLRRFPIMQMTDMFTTSSSTMLTLLIMPGNKGQIQFNLDTKTLYQFFQTKDLFTHENPR